MGDQVRVGVIGTSAYADGTHLPNLKSHADAHIAAICSRNRERAQEMADKYDIPAVYTDYHQMLEHAGLDAVVIAVPDDLHYPMTMDALAAGLHVLCEKPLALNAQQALAMTEKARMMGVKHMTFFAWRFEPYHRYLHQLMGEGYVGRPYLCQFRQVGGYGRDGLYAWRFDTQHGNGILGDLGSHMIDMAHWLVGDITRVSAHLTTSVERTAPDAEPLRTPANDSALLTVEFANGACGAIVVSAVAHMAEREQFHEVSLYGEAGTLELNTSSLAVQMRGVRQGQTQFEVLTVPDEFRKGVDLSLPLWDRLSIAMQTQSVGDRQFIDAILNDRPVAPNFEDGLKVQAVIDAALESQRSGCRIQVRTRG
ncbi:MAG: Gfo/Idh/MocA family oxidoreductase [Caldilineaceae bacterium]